MAATTLVIPETDSEEGYERPIDIQTEGLGAAGFYPQHPDAGAADLVAGIERDALDNLILRDAYVVRKLSDLIGSSALHSGFFEVSLPAGCDTVEGTITGLSIAPVKVVGQTVREKSVTVQSGVRFVFTPYELTSDGFKYSLSCIDDEYWPGPGPIVLRVDYLWSDT